MKSDEFDRHLIFAALMNTLPKTNDTVCASAPVVLNSSNCERAGADVGGVGLWRAGVKEEVKTPSGGDSLVLRAGDG